MTKYFLTLFSLTLLLAACVPSAPKRADVKTEVVIAIPGDPVSLDPANTISSFDFAFLDMTYQQLTGIDATSANGTVVGELAKSWTIAPDRMSWTFVLNAGQRFDDGTPVDAEAVRYSIDRIRAIGRGADQGLFWLKSVDVLDASTVRFNLTQPFSAVATYLALPNFSILNPRIVKMHEKGDDKGLAWLGENTAGSGIYRLSQWRRGEALTLEANPNSATKPKQFTRVTFAVIPNEGTQRLQLEKGDIDFTYGLGAAQAETYRALKGVTISKAPFTMEMKFLTLNTQRPALKDRRIRQAIAFAIDYDALRSKILKGNAIGIDGMLPANVPGGNIGLPRQTRDLSKARALLAEAGYSPEKPLQLMVTAYGPVSEFVQAQLKEAGLNVVLQRLAPSAIEATRASGNFDFFYDGWVMDVPDPALFFNFAFSERYISSGVNASRFTDPDVEAKLAAAMSEPDAEKRASLYRAVELRLLEERPIVMLFATPPIAAHRSTLAGIRMNPYQTSYLNIQDWTRTE